MGNKGWIKLHRQILDCDLWLTDEPFSMGQAWIDLLLRANHQDKEMIFDYKTITVGRGQLITSVRKLADRWKWGNQKTLKFLRLLEEMKMIEKQSDNRRTLLTIVNYTIYQDTENTDGTQIDTLSEQYQNADRTQIDHKQEYKELKNLKNEKKVKNNNTFCSELETNSEPPIIQIPLNDNSLFDVTQTMVDEYQEIYPSVDVMQQLRNMKGWCLSNPRNRKTRSGVRRFINSWLAKEQNKGGRQQSSAYMDSIKDRVNVVDDWV